MLYIIIAIIIIALDQITKYLVSVNIAYGELITVVENFFYITYHHNYGAAWGILQNARFFFIGIGIISSAAMIFIILKSESKFLNYSLAFLLGGAVGNLIDRIIRVGVTDFLDFYIGSYHFPTFNVADMSIVLGSILIAIYILFLYKDIEEDGGQASYNE
jgi:signal peptidase II